MKQSHIDTLKRMRERLTWLGDYDSIATPEDAELICLYHGVDAGIGLTLFHAGTNRTQKFEEAIWYHHDNHHKEEGRPLKPLGALFRRLASIHAEQLTPSKEGAKEGNSGLLIRMLDEYMGEAGGLHMESGYLKRRISVERRQGDEYRFWWTDDEPPGQWFTREDLYSAATKGLKELEKLLKKAEKLL